MFKFVMGVFLVMAYVAVLAEESPVEGVIHDDGSATMRMSKEQVNACIEGGGCTLITKAALEEALRKSQRAAGKTI